MMRSVLLVADDRSIHTHLLLSCLGRNALPPRPGLVENVSRTRAQPRDLLQSAMRATLFCTSFLRGFTGFSRNRAQAQSYRSTIYSLSRLLWHQEGGENRRESTTYTTAVRPEERVTLKYHAFPLDVHDSNVSCIRCGKCSSVYTLFFRIYYHASSYFFIMKILLISPTPASLQKPQHGRPATVRVHKTGLLSRTTGGWLLGLLGN